MVGGLALSQALTLFTTPVVYLYLDRAHRWFERHAAARRARLIVADVAQWHDAPTTVPEPSQPLGARLDHEPAATTLSTVAATESMT
jgi:hypothetical protein